jgi:hypothetical protein
MRCFTITATVYLTSAFLSTLAAQSSGVFWIKSFSPGSASLSDPHLDRQALAKLDSLMQDETIAVTLLGAADSVAWHLNGRRVHPNLSDAWDVAKSLGRARALRARYGRGEFGVTHENIAGVKVIWTKRTAVEMSLERMNQLAQQSDSLGYQIKAIKSDLQKINAERSGYDRSAANGHYEVNRKTVRNLDWRLKLGVWSWHSANGGIVSPALALHIIVDRTAFVLQGGVTPWHYSTEFGNQSESFLHAGMVYMKSDRLGFSLGGFRGWEFFTATDNWSFKTTGLAAGVVLIFNKIEFSPKLSYSNITALQGASHWRAGGILSVSFNLN